jgi:tRNA threonylcarbamoyladenosine biosynthesis protein TsaB
MLTLAMDTAGRQCSLAFGQDGKTLASAKDAAGRGQDARILPMILALLQTKQKSLADIEVFLVSRGPGSFTGLRLGLAAAHGLTLVHQKPLFGIQRFDLYADAIEEKAEKRKTEKLIVLHSGREELYAALYDHEGKRGEPMMLSALDLAEKFKAHSLQKDFVVGGDGHEVLGPLFPKTRFVDLPTTEAEAMLHFWHRHHGQYADSAAEPFYIRPPDVTFPKAS